MAVVTSSAMAADGPEVPDGVRLRDADRYHFRVIYDDQHGQPRTYEYSSPSILGVGDVVGELNVRITKVERKPTRGSLVNVRGRLMASHGGNLTE